MFFTKSKKGYIYTIVLICFTFFLGSCNVISQQEQKSNDKLENTENSTKPLQPLKVGNTWTYKIETEDDQFSAINEITNVKPNELGGKEFEGQELYSNKQKSISYRIVKKKNEFRYIYDDHFSYLFKTNSENNEYTYVDPYSGNKVKVTVSPTKISLPFGDFTGLEYTINSNKENSTWVFVRGIGFVFYTVNQNTESKLEITLQRYNLK